MANPKAFLVKYVPNRVGAFYIVVNSPYGGTMTREEAKAAAKYLNEN